MSRVKGGIKRTKHRRNLHKLTKGFEAGRKNLVKLAKTAIKKAGAHAYRDRRVKKRDFRALWEIQINAGARLNGTSYSKLIGALKAKKINLNRKMLAELAGKYPEVFAKLVESVK
jgi:large subunit ribosomal protein L20